MGHHNWKSSADNVLLVWDSGLAWNSGPYNGKIPFLLRYPPLTGEQADTEILCGTNAWNGDDPTNTPHNIKRPNCTRICRFRDSTIDILTHYSREMPPEASLGSQLRREMAKDAIPAAFESGLYNIQRNSGLFWWWNVAARFQADDFYRGIDHRVRVLLAHVDDCIERYGREEVLL